MPRKLAHGSKIILATSNIVKKREILNLLEPYGLDIIFSDNLKPKDHEENGRTFCENALIKAQAYLSGDSPVLSDDSGLVIPALNGRPGIFSARFAEEVGGYPRVFEVLEQELSSSKDYRAYFECCLVLLWPEGHGESFSGRVEGTLVFPPRGYQGQKNYDSIFIPEGSTKTFAEMKLEEKQQISHRAQAVRKLIQYCLEP